MSATGPAFFSLNEDVVSRPPKPDRGPPGPEQPMPSRPGEALTLGDRTEDPQQAEIHVDVCSACHPFYTGKQKLMDSGGRVERFQRRLEKAGGARRG